MRLSPQSMRLLAVMGVGLAAVVAACSSSSTEEVLAGDAGSDAPSSSFDSGATDTSTTVVDTGTKPETSTVFDAGPQYDAGAPIILDGGAQYEGGVPCVQGGVLEVEPNNAPGTATSFTTSICGATDAVADGGDAAAELDFVTFTLKASTSTFYMQYAGDITLTITVDGQSVTLPGSTSIPFVKNKPYIVEVKPNNPTATTFWRVSLFES